MARRAYQSKPLGLPQTVTASHYSTLTSAPHEVTESSDENSTEELPPAVAVKRQIVIHPKQIRLQHSVLEQKRIEEIDVLTGLLSGPQAKEVVIFGENNFTFQLALATLRNCSWDGIYDGVQKYDAEKLNSIDFCSQNGRKLGISEKNILENIQILLQTPIPPASKIEEGKVVWYQYPWGKSGPVLREALDEMRDKQKPNDYLLYGMLTGKSCDVRDYKLTEVLDDKLSKKEYNGYKFLGGDTSLMKKILLFGYREINDANMHAQSMTDHVVLVFQRNE